MRKFTKIIKSVFEKEIAETIKYDEKQVMEKIKKGQKLGDFLNKQKNN